MTSQIDEGLPQTYDRELIAAARALRYENPAGWAQFLEEHPELAAATETVSRDAKGTGSPRGYEPYRCWQKSDRGRWVRTNGTSPENARPNRPIDYERLRTDGTMSLVQLHEETNGGYSVGPSVIANQNQLEVCRVCQKPLDLQTDDDGIVHRAVGNQPEYCSQRCRKLVKNARERAKRAEESPRRKPPRQLPDLAKITVAGIGDMETSPSEWNRMQPRRPELFRPVPAPLNAVAPRPYSAEREDYKLHLHRSIVGLRRRPADRCTPSRPDAIARRWGTGGAPRPPELAAGWDRVVTRWRFVPRSKPTEHALSRETECVWRISHHYAV